MKMLSTISMTQIQSVETRYIFISFLPSVTGHCVHLSDFFLRWHICCSLTSLKLLQGHILNITSLIFLLLLFVCGPLQNTFVGLTNLGATCYVNTFLQVWFHNLELRRSLYQCHNSRAQAHDIESGTTQCKIPVMLCCFVCLNFVSMFSSFSIQLAQAH